MGKTFKKFEGSTSAEYKRSLRKEKRTNLKWLAKELEQGNYDAEVDYYGALYNSNVDHELHIKFLTPYIRRKFLSKIDYSELQSHHMTNMMPIYGQIYAGFMLSHIY